MEVAIQGVASPNIPLFVYHRIISVHEHVQTYDETMDTS